MDYLEIKKKKKREREKFFWNLAEIQNFSDIFEIDKTLTLIVNENENLDVDNDAK